MKELIRIVRELTIRVTDNHMKQHEVNEQTMTVIERLSMRVAELESKQCSCVVVPPEDDMRKCQHCGASVHKNDMYQHGVDHVCINCKMKHMNKEWIKS